MTVTAADPDLGDLLADAARGDLAAFMRFYDSTSDLAFCLALSRARVRGVNGLDARAAAEAEAQQRFVMAWEHAGGYGSSGLSPVAWLLSLAVPNHHSTTHVSQEEPCPL